MIGFVVEKIDIHSNIEHINTLAKTSLKEKSSIIEKIHKEYFIPDFEHHYSSVHNDCDGDIFTLYHLMFDVSDNLLEV
jgi:hypothetical protein